MPIVAKQRVRFGPFELDTRARELYKRGLKLKLQGHPIDILAMLLERPGDLITREEVQQKLWPTESETFVDFEHGLNTAVRKLRQVLGDEAETPQYIETLPRRGYRFVGAITVEEAEQAPATESSVVATDLLQEAIALKPAESAAGVSASVPAAAEKQPHRKQLSMRPLLVLLLVAASIGVGLFLFRFARSAPGGLVVTGTRHLTYLVGVTGRPLTDGRRIYFVTPGNNPLRYVSADGGDPKVIPITLSMPRILDVSRDGSFLLLSDFFGKKGGLESSIWLLDVNSGSARKLGDIEAQDAAFAPDGNAIVVAEDRFLYLTDMQGVTPVKLAEVPDGKIFWPRWSPDGRRLRFSVWNAKPFMSSLWELSRDGLLRKLSLGSKQAGSVCCGEWTAEGKYYLFKSDEQYWWVKDSSWAEPTLLTTMGNSIGAAASNPLADTIYVSVQLGSGVDIFKWDLTPGHTPTILYPELKTNALEFSRDAQWITYSHKTPAGYDLWRARTDGRDKLQLTTNFAGIYMVRYSPDGSKIAMMAIRPDGPWKIYWVSADGGALHEIPGPPSIQADPAWSADSQSIMFGLPPESWGAGGPEVPRRLYLYDLRTGKTTEVPGSRDLFSPRWSPDGRYVVAMTTDFQGLSLLDTTTSEWRPLTRHQSTNSPFWSADSVWVYFNNVSETSLWRVRITDGHVEDIGQIPSASNYEAHRALDFAPDGSVLGIFDDSRTDIFALDYKEQK